MVLTWEALGFSTHPLALMVELPPHSTPPTSRQGGHAVSESPVFPFPSLVVFALAAHSSVAVFYSTLTPEQVWSDFPIFLDNCFIFLDPKFVPDLWAFKVTFLPPTRFWHLEAQSRPPSGRLLPPTSFLL